MSGMPTKDLTVEFWAKTPKYDTNAPGHNPLADLLVYATHIPEADSFCELLSTLQCYEHHDTEKSALSLLLLGNPYSEALLRLVQLLLGIQLALQ